VSYRWLEHTSELELRIDAPGDQAVFEEAVAALSELVETDEQTAGGADSPVARVVEVAPADRAALLAAFLEELVNLIETDDLIPERAENVELLRESLTATARGHRGGPRHLVKGVMYHELTFAHADRGFTATVVLDDINRGVRLLALSVGESELGTRREALVHEISRRVPVGAGHGGALRLSRAALDRVLAVGPQALLERGFGTTADVERTESSGCLAGADPGAVSERARERGADQLGTLGSGNHFLELQRVRTVIDPLAGEAFGLREGQVTVLIHSGSRGLGHEVCTDYVRRMDAALARYRITLPDRQLACAPLSSPEGQDYLGAMAAAANFAWANRAVLAHRVREAVALVLGDEIAGRRARCTPAAWALEFRARRSGARDRAVLRHHLPRGRAADESHGRAPANHRCRAASGAEARGIVVRCSSARGLAEEAQFAYKDVEHVVAVVERAGLASRVAQLEALGVVKG
jgi:tRNA-splicing ligase RtcB (3'-phosphate/5'-hydroxy nucleic acid ligase)